MKNLLYKYYLSFLHKNFFAEGYLFLYPDVAESGMDPWEHYIRYGKKEGRTNGFPCSFQFSAEEYLELNQDVAESGINPWKHYVLYGHKEGRKIHDKNNISNKKIKHNIINKIKLFIIKFSFDEDFYLSVHSDVRNKKINAWKHFYRYGFYEGRIYSSKKYEFHKYGFVYNIMRCVSRIICYNNIKKYKNCKILVHIHLYYMNAWKEIEEYVKNIDPYNCDIIVTYTDIMKNEDVINKIKRNNRITVIEYPNKGFDIGPFLDLINNVDEKKYDIIYHLHSKSISYTNRYGYNKMFIGKEWFLQLYKGILGLFNVHKVIDILNGNNKIGIICANNLIFRDNAGRIDLIKRFCHYYNIHCDDDYTFVGGSCFAMRASLITKIKELNIDINKFDYSRRGIFTLAHALERIIPIIIKNSGYSIYGTYVFHTKHMKLIKKYIQNEQLHSEYPIQILSSHGFYDIQVKKVDTPSGLRCRFFTGSVNGKKCFIKWGGDSSVCLNEYNMLLKCSQKSPFFLQPVSYHVSSSYCFIATELLSGINLEQQFEIGINKEQADFICKNIYKMVVFLQEEQLIHRDIRPSNIFICDDGRIILLDTQFMTKIVNNKIIEIPYILKNRHVFYVLGDKYRKGKYEWDDMYSYELIKKEIYNNVYR
ncbi:rhamnan synthesis F family protein [uncultured Mailhella sp.]|uniref:rhamnan synthesis F family protein n=1 Tax=uncultured Mailhella sp. TaxID=1981031 RepID=UPI0025EEB926|nr:rhamnan synthesis F family protein [uncultured Mailhella sp.]